LKTSKSEHELKIDLYIACYLFLIGTLCHNVISWRGITLFLKVALFFTWTYLLLVRTLQDKKTPPQKKRELIAIS